MQKAQVHTIILLLVFLLLSGCGSGGNAEFNVNLGEVFPPELPLIGDKAWRFDVDHDGRNEWLVMYHVDMMVNDVSGSPTVAAVYRPVNDQDSRMAPSIIPALLWVPGQGYVCLGNCQPGMMDAISSSGGEELVFADIKCVGGECKDTVGAALFRWQSDLDLTIRETMPDRCMASGEFLATLACGGFVPLGSFRGDLVSVGLDQVTVIYRHNDRSDLASREIYRPVNGRYYKQAVRDVDDFPGELLSPSEAEIIFATGAPENPLEVKVPEKLVLSFYNNYNNATEVQKYFTPEAWIRFGQECANGACGCNFRREDVSRVMVKQLGYEADLKPFVTVIAQVVCVDSGGNSDLRNTVAWTLERQTDSTWRLHNVLPGGEEYLCPITGCGRIGGGE